MLKTLVLLLGALAIGSAGCGGDDDDDSSADATTVDATIGEWFITLEPSTVPAGDVHFVIQNDGDDEHEFVVIQTDLAEDALPTTPDGRVDEEGEGIAAIGESEGIETGTSGTLDLSLEPGSYVTVCNIHAVEGGEVENHYELGMHGGFTVE